ncbi:RING-H2 finger protein ATL64-like [Tasmannia lanceolata]|uniref:RING-H2 finger protein ATL64-like n=1 Tax=Tasmannia lanceolata TaxID=3420 RepID=UPI0040630501
MAVRSHNSRPTDAFSVSAELQPRSVLVAYGNQSHDDYGLDFNGCAFPSWMVMLGIFFGVIFGVVCFVVYLCWIFRDGTGGNVGGQPAEQGLDHAVIERFPIVDYSIVKKRLNHCLSELEDEENL